MNIFVLDRLPTVSAQTMCDKHVIKMILESAQLLCGAHHLHPLHALPDKFYKLTHKNHPAAIWTRTNTGNYSWLSCHAHSLLEEYTYRYGKTHASTSVIQWCNNYLPDIPSGNQTPFTECMPDEFKVHDPVESYRRYYFFSKRESIKMTWTKRNPPYWFNEGYFNEFET